MCFRRGHVREGVKKPKRYGLVRNVLSHPPPLKAKKFFDRYINRLKSLIQGRGGGIGHGHTQELGLEREKVIYYPNLFWCKIFWCCVTHSLLRKSRNSWRFSQGFYYILENCRNWKRFRLLLKRNFNISFLFLSISKSVFCSEVLGRG